MSLHVHRLLIITVVGLVLLLSHALTIANWLDEAGVIAWVHRFKTEFVTGTAITVIVVLLILMPGVHATGAGTRWLRRCRVCGHLLLRAGRYCPGCGGRV